MEGPTSKARSRSAPRTSRTHKHGEKLGTFAGVFIPTTLSVLSILMFVRFSFILGQSGVLGMMGLLIACYAINLVTTMSISAIASNGQVRGGGAYYLISRTLGPEFGGSIGIVFYLGCVFNAGMNAVGLIDCLKYNFGSTGGSWSRRLPDTYWFSYLWTTMVLVLCTGICFAGSALFAKANKALFLVLLIAALSIPFSAIFKAPFESARLAIEFTGPSLSTLRNNTFPRFTPGADGGQETRPETWHSLFGILFPATGGIFAGASFSGDLKHPSKAIPKGTLYGLALTFAIYSLVILALGATVTRGSLYNNVNVIQHVNLSGVVVFLGEFAATLFSTLMGLTGSAKLLQAIARDNLVPGLSIFGRGTKGADEPAYAILITYAVAQLTILADINRIASLVTMTYLMTFLCTNLACFVLDVGSAPNFRPSFRYFNWHTAALGAVLSIAIMFFVDGLYASGSVAVLLSLFLLIHYTAPPKSWGDVSQSLIYHQVRKYLLQLRPDHIKFWRPSVLLLVNDPRRQYKLIQFCNSLKKGALFVLGHVIVSDDFASSLPEAKQQQGTWMKFIDVSKIKAFMNIAIAPVYEWGARNIVLSAGLGGMRPNLIIVGFFNARDVHMSQTLVDISSSQPPHSASPDLKNAKNLPQHTLKDPIGNKLGGVLPTDVNRPEGAISAKSYVTILEDLLIRLKLNVGVAKGFDKLELPTPINSKFARIRSWMSFRELVDENVDEIKYIDLWPIQMSAEITTDDVNTKSVLTTNFDTYTLILQLGAILNTVRRWKQAFKLRVSVFVEYESDVEEERTRVVSLLTKLRIKGSVRVFWLASGDAKTYEVLVNGRDDEAFQDALKTVDTTLRDDSWWQEISAARHQLGKTSALDELAEGDPHTADNADEPPTPTKTGTGTSFSGVKNLLRKARRRASITGVTTVMKLQASPLNRNLVRHSRAYDSSSDGSSSEDENMDDSGSSSSDSDTETPLLSVDGTRSSLRKSQSLGESMRDRVFGTPKRNLNRSTSKSPARLSNDERGKSIPAGSARGSSGSTPISSPQVLPNMAPPPRPRSTRNQIAPRFTSTPVPATQIATTEDEPGPSIRFAEPTTPQHDGDTDIARESIYARPSNESPSRPASGYPSTQSTPFTFNDLSCRAQYLVLNELMVAQSADAAVVFTTLPSPVEGTGASEEDSMKYLSDLELFCHGLPPTMLVHSNSITVTMNL